MKNLQFLSMLNKIQKLLVIINSTDLSEYFFRLNSLIVFEE
jgi:hypothetical protein